MDYDLGVEIRLNFYCWHLLITLIFQPSYLLNFNKDLFCPSNCLACYNQKILNLRRLVVKEKSSSSIIAFLVCWASRKRTKKDENPLFFHPFTLSWLVGLVKSLQFPTELSCLYFCKTPILKWYVFTAMIKNMSQMYCNPDLDDCYRLLKSWKLSK